MNCIAPCETPNKPGTKPCKNVVQCNNSLDKSNTLNIAIQFDSKFN